MEGIETYFNDTIAAYNRFEQEALLLLEDIPNLQARQIEDRCEDLVGMHREIMENSDQLCVVMDYVGPAILNTPYIGEFQRSLDRSAAVCQTLFTEITDYKARLKEKLSVAQPNS